MAALGMSFNDYTAAKQEISLLEKWDGYTRTRFRSPIPAGTRFRSIANATVLGSHFAFGSCSPSTGVFIGFRLG